MRKLGLQDVFAMSEILDVMDIKVDIANLLNEAQDKTDMIEYVGGQVGLSVLKNFHKVDKQVYKWVSSLKDISIEEAKNLSFKDLKELFLELLQQEEILDFFNSLGPSAVTSNSLSSED